MPNTTCVSIIQYGLGQVGRALLSQVLAGRAALAERTCLELRHVALVDSAGTLVDSGGLGDTALQAALAAKEAGKGLSALPGSTARSAGPVSVPGLEGPAVLVDVTAADGMEAASLAALAAGWGVVLANKRSLAGPVDTFRRLTESRRLRCEATVGAGLPWIEMLQHLLDTGDRVLRLEAAVSGTLGYLCSQLEAGVPYSAAVREAKRLGYTEPDPRDDLSAADVRRKGLILARLLGGTPDWDDLPAEALYPAEWHGLTVPEFMERLPELDGPYAARMAAAQARGCTLRYAVAIEGGKASVGLREVGKGSPLGALVGPNCLLSLWTERYSTLPLVISGPGAGASVTAAGVYADIIALGLEL
jgi:homoserine dehydrogenase